MDTQRVVVFCLWEDMLKAWHSREDRQCQLTNAEILTSALGAMLYFGGNFRRARQSLGAHGYIPNRLSRSRFKRRLPRIAEGFWTWFLR